MPCAGNRTDTVRRRDMHFRNQQEYLRYLRSTPTEPKQLEEPKAAPVKNQETQDEGKPKSRGKKA